MDERRRNSFDIMADMIKIAQNGARKTQLVYKCNLNFSIVKRYIGDLIEKGYIYFNDPYYHATDEGRTYLNRYELLTLR